MEEVILANTPLWNNLSLLKMVWTIWMENMNGKEGQGTALFADGLWQFGFCLPIGLSPCQMGRAFRPTGADGKVVLLPWGNCQEFDISSSVFQQNFVSHNCSQAYYPKHSVIIVSRCFDSALTFFFNALQLFSVSQIKHCFYPENRTSNLDHSSAFWTFSFNSGEYLVLQAISALKTYFPGR